MKTSLKVNAKINLAINVGKRLENGYHEVDMIMQSISLYDRIEIETIENSDEFSLSLSNSTLVPDESNTALIAARLFNREYPMPFGLKINIEKNIPEAAGMAGGSADAGGVLVALNKLNKNPLSEETLMKLAQEIGSDVPFMINGGTQRIGGTGEKLKSISPLPNCSLIIVKNSVKKSTAEMYRRLDETDKRKKTDISRLEMALKEGNLKKCAPFIDNDFCTVWDSDVMSVISRLKDDGAIAATVTGSGPSVFGIFESSDIAKSVYQKMKNEYAEVFMAFPEEHSIKFL